LDVGVLIIVKEVHPSFNVNDSNASNLCPKLQTSVSPVKVRLLRAVHIVNPLLITECTEFGIVIDSKLEQLPNISE
jgi:hypothetical protein